MMKDQEMMRILWKCFLKAVSFGIVLFMLYCCEQLFARASGSALSVPVFFDDGGNRESISISVGSNTPVAYFDVMITTMPEKRIRNIVIINPSENYDLLIGTTSQLKTNGSYWFINSGSGSWSTSNHQKFWMIYPDGAPDETVRGYIESE